MSQNLSHAVMAQRHEPADSLDFFPTPPWATRALCEFINGLGAPLKSLSCWEPACGQGHMARPLAEYFGTVAASDVYPYGFGETDDFLMPGSRRRADWIVTNPPFRLGRQFIHQAIKSACRGVAILARTVFLEGAGRYRAIYDTHRPTFVLQFVERVPMVKGRLDQAASSATSYCWLVWDLTKPPNSPTTLGWIEPCRRRLEKPEDYR